MPGLSGSIAAEVALGVAAEIDVEVAGERRILAGGGHAQVFAGVHEGQLAAGDRETEVVLVGAAAGILPSRTPGFRRSARGR